MDFVKHFCFIYLWSCDFLFFSNLLMRWITLTDFQTGTIIARQHISHWIVVCISFNSLLGFICECFAEGFGNFWFIYIKFVQDFNIRVENQLQSFLNRKLETRNIGKFLNSESFFNEYLRISSLVELLKWLFLSHKYYCYKKDFCVIFYIFNFS